ncbi:hypothetical protein CH330_01535 [candidate division WOR-3 bacterium JGI_Cruoil_03_51_56]|uniref:Uncharacterized protein n=1 Tax=candidate division WOR-3 bacterium JGI_Cruoil_03_51_56 TaxID=1973747 RepID=A0A235BXV2_UNCW3|nr:MAG: hypothetical protein CH330_01535 [candidate division WOR-3 bacterium JGI_Cruoil_03_51_56]
MIERLLEFKAFMQIIPKTPQELEEKMRILKVFLSQNKDLEPFLLKQAVEDLARLWKIFSERNQTK